MDADAHTVTVSGGVTYGQLCQHLHEAGYAIHNMASLPHITVAGACATATHGSGDRLGNLATAISALEIVKADGERITLSRQNDGERFLGVPVNLGGLGVVTQVTLDVTPTFIMQQEVYLDLPVAQIDADFDAIMSSAYSVSLFTDWQRGVVSELWVKRQLADGKAIPVAERLFEAAGALREMHPLADLSAESCTPQLGVPGPWHERMPHFRVNHTPASGDELQSEYFVPRQHAVAAMNAIISIIDEIGAQLKISEVRTVAADQLWMSPSYGRETVGLHFSFRNNWSAVKELLPIVEAQLAPFEARPHWGKLFTMEASRVQSLYPRLADFRALASEFDPEGKFRNRYLDTYIFA